MSSSIPRLTEQSSPQIFLSLDTLNNPASIALNEPLKPPRVHNNSLFCTPDLLEEPFLFSDPLAASSSSSTYLTPPGSPSSLRSRVTPVLSNFDKVINTMRNLYPSMPKEPLERLINTIFLMQASIDDGTALSIEASDQFAHKMIITNKRIHILEKQVGTGTYTTVFRSTVVPTVQHHVGDVYFTPTKPTVNAIKEAKLNVRTRSSISFSPQKQKLDGIFSNSKEGLDDCKETFKLTSGQGYSLNTLYDNTLNKIDFITDTADPLAAILETLIPMAKSLSLMHEKGWIHRDIKPENCLVKLPSKDGSSVETCLGGLSDFDFLMKQKNNYHDTIGTSLYLDPFMFGPIGSSAVNQKQRAGIQDREGDVYAFGLTILNGILMNFIKKAAENTPHVNQIKSFITCKILPRKIYGQFTDDDLIQNSRSFGFLVHDITYGTRPKEILYVYEPAEVIEMYLLKVCELVQSRFNDKENHVLRELSILSCRMRRGNRAARLDAKAVYEKLVGLMDGYKSQNMSRKREIGEITISLPVTTESSGSASLNNTDPLDKGKEEVKYYK